MQFQRAYRGQDTIAEGLHAEMTGNKRMSSHPVIPETTTCISRRVRERERTSVGSLFLCIVSCVRSTTEGVQRLHPGSLSLLFLFLTNGFHCALQKYRVHAEFNGRACKRHRDRLVKDIANEYWYALELGDFAQSRDKSIVVGSCIRYFIPATTFHFENLKFRWNTSTLPIYKCICI